MAPLKEAALEAGMPYLHLPTYRADRNAVTLIGYEVANRFQVMPLFLEAHRLMLAVIVPDDLAARDYVGRLTGYEIEPVLVEREALAQALNQYYVAEGQSGLEWGRLASQSLDRPTRPEAAPRLTEGGDSPVARLFEQLVAQAVHLRASDLHLEISHTRPRLRYRIDGVLNDFPAPPADVYPALVSRIKILAHLDIAERRRPQDGRITLQLEGRTLELRVSVIPYLDGEGVVVRVLGAGAGVLPLDEIGFSPTVLARYRQLLRRHHGLVLVTGPTGAGKTTTLYASLAEIYSPKLKIVTLEDPVEYRLEGICQIPVRPEVDFSFADGLRAVLRHDPDVLMIGEIRDLESAEIAVRASMTGHLIFATLHTNSASQAVTRLVDIGVAPYKVMTSLVMVLAQRLLRVLCPHCKREEPADLSPDFHLSGPVRNFVAVGCDSCGGLGYQGRVPVYEFLELNDAMRALPTEQIMSGRLLELAQPGEFSSTRECAWRLYAEGLTSLEEIEGMLLES